jgi:folate-binding protein YgfZ
MHQLEDRTIFLTSTRSVCFPSNDPHTIPSRRIFILSVTALECGLMHGLHFRKGCYVGQETISKTVSMTSNAVRRRLCALSIKQQGGPAAAVAGDAILDQDGERSSFFLQLQCKVLNLLHVSVYVTFHYALRCRVLQAMSWES